MAEVSYELQKAIYDALVADAGVGALVADRIFDDVDDDYSGYPFVTIGQDDMSEAGAKGYDGNEHALTFHVWSNDGGRRETKLILGSIKSALHDVSLTLGGGFSLVNLRWQGSEVTPDIDENIYHGIINFRAVTE